jgi:hypothetical protein
MLGSRPELTLVVRIQLLPHSYNFLALWYERARLRLLLHKSMKIGLSNYEFALSSYNLKHKGTSGTYITAIVPPGAACSRTLARRPLVVIQKRQCGVHICSASSNARLLVLCCSYMAWKFACTCLTSSGVKSGADMRVSRRLVVPRVWRMNSYVVGNVASTKMVRDDLLV